MVDIRKRKWIKNIVLWIAAFFLIIFSIDMPALGYKNLDYIPQTNSYKITKYSWYGAPLIHESFEGDSDEALKVFQNQTRVQRIQSVTMVFALMAILSWWARERKLYTYGSAWLAVIFLVIDIMVVIRLS
ncbi:hypothetical protein ACGTN9_11655 [Halobacillus sp. MO56]